MADADGFAKRRAESRKRGKLRGLGMSNTIERAAAPEHRRRGDPLRSRRHDHAVLRLATIRARATRPRSSRSSATGSASIPKDVTYISRATPTRCSSARAPAARAPATLGGSAVAGAADKVIAKGKKIAAHVLKVGVEDVKFEDGMFSSPKTNQTMTIGDVARDRLQSGQAAEGHGAGPVRRPRSSTPTPRTSRTARMSARSRSTRRPGTIEIVRYSVVDDVGTVINPLLVKGQITGGVAQGIGQILMEDIHFDRGSGQLTTGSFMDYAMPRADNISALNIHSQPGADADQSARRQGLRRGRLRRRHAGGRQRDRRRAVGLRRPPHRDAGDAGAGLARDPGGAAASCCGVERLATIRPLLRSVRGRASKDGGPNGSRRPPSAGSSP